MVMADGLAIGVGALLHRRLPQQLLHVLASLLFLIFGLWMLFDRALGLRPLAICRVHDGGAGCGATVATPNSPTAPAN